ncbi:thiamine phosphate synthase [bacterium]|nr:thiamine phosphate synthase [bacterium]
MQIDLYPVVTEAYCLGRSSLSVCRDVIAGGAKIIQLREKDKDKAALIALAQEVRAYTLAADVLLIINDYVDVALAVGADGVHLGQEDMPIAQAREMAPQLLLGISTHTIQEAITAEQAGADYINIGPVFATRTKQLVFSALGPERVQEISRFVSIPFTVMGGIHENNIAEVLKIGARKIAMVTEITQAENIVEKVKTLRIDFV